MDWYRHQALLISALYMEGGCEVANPALVGLGYSHVQATDTPKQFL